MDVRVLVGDRVYGGYKTDQYKIHARKLEREGVVDIDFGYGYDSSYPLNFTSEQGEQQGGSITIDVDAAEWLAYALLNLCSDYDNRKYFTLKFDAEEMEYEAADSSENME